jgi:alpha-L-arabinofuranosidase
VVGDSAVAADSEAMNSRDNPKRITAKESAVKVSDKMFAYEFAPFTITLVEIRLHGD